MSDKPTQPTGVRVLVCGGRDYTDEGAIFGHLDTVHADRRIDCIISGGAPGADHIAAKWAMLRGVGLREFQADWQAHGRAAGPIRNRQMLAEGRPDEVVAFRGGRGTADMIRAARTAGVPVWTITMASEPTKATAWRPIASAPDDGTIVWVYTAAAHDLPAFQGPCSFHPDAGWCTDELREVTHWVPLQAVYLEPPL